MPPKKPKQPEPTLQQELAPPPPDPAVLLYFQAASRAFPYIERMLKRETKKLEQDTTTAHTVAKTSRGVSLKAVEEYAHDRQRFEAEIETLLTTKRTLKQEIIDAEDSFKTEKRNKEVEYSVALAELRARENELAADSREAQEWIDQAATRFRELQGARDAIEAKQKSYDDEIERMHQNHEEEKRKLRDALVRKLRRVRDHMTAEPGHDEGAALGPGDVPVDPAAASMDTSGANTARINEELSREVSVKERDAAAQQANIAQLEEEENVLNDKLKKEQEANTALLLRNASHIKTRRALEAKLTDLQGQLQQVIGRRDAQERERLAALRGTVAMQATVIDDLNSEIDIKIGELSKLRKQIHMSRAARTSSESKTSAAVRFLWACAADARNALTQSLEDRTPSPSDGAPSPRNPAAGALVPVAPPASTTPRDGRPGLVPRPHFAPGCEPLVVPRSTVVDGEQNDGTGGDLVRLTRRSEIAACLLSVLSSNGSP